MNKPILLIVSVVLLFVFSSSYSGSVPDGTVGRMAPAFSLTNNDTTVSIQGMKGKYVLLSFWSSWDAKSRINNMEYFRYAEQNNSKIDLVGINYDRDASLYGALVEQDNLNTTTQFYDQNFTKSKIYEKYHLDRGLKSVLIDPSGMIIAENPTLARLSSIVNQ